MKWHKRCGKLNHFEGKCLTQVTQVSKIENSSASDDLFDYAINNKYKVSSKNIVKLRINNLDIDF